jgi:hypothetical protein
VFHSPHFILSGLLLVINVLSWLLNQITHFTVQSFSNNIIVVMHACTHSQTLLPSPYVLSDTFVLARKLFPSSCRCTVRHACFYSQIMLPSLHEYNFHMLELHVVFLRFFRSAQCVKCNYSIYQVFVYCDFVNINKKQINLLLQLMH